MSYEIVEIGRRSMAIRCTTEGLIVHINEENGLFTVSEDPHSRSFDTFERALACARQIAGDPDLPQDTSTIH